MESLGLLWLVEILVESLMLLVEGHVVEVHWGGWVLVVGTRDDGEDFGRRWWWSTREIVETLDSSELDTSCFAVVDLIAETE